MFKLLGLLFALFMMLQFSCKQNCENVKVGEVELTDSANSFLVYEQGQQVSFSNQDGTVINFSANKTENVYFICQEITCRPIDPYKSDFCEYVEAPIIEMFLQSDSTLLGITATVQAYESESDLFYDPIKFTLSHVNDGITASHIIAARFTDPPFKKSEILDIDHYVSFQNSVVIRDKQLQDVYVFEDGDLAIYFKEGEGFVAFKTNGNLWLKDN